MPTIYTLTANDVALAEFWTANGGANRETLLDALSAGDITAVQKFLEADRATTAPASTSVVGWEYDTGKIYKPSGLAAGNWTLSAGGAPVAHAASHASGGGDPITLAQSQVTNLTTDLSNKVTNTRNVSTSGLAGGGGNLSADRTIDVPIATQGEAEIGAINTKAMTPLRTAQAIAALGSTLQIFTPSGAITEHTVPGSSASSPSPMTLTFTSIGGGQVSITVDGTTFYVTFANSDPSNGHLWIDDSFIGDTTGYASALAAAWSNPSVSATADGSVVTFAHSGTGTASTLSGGGGSIANAVGGGSGTNAVEPSGGVSILELIPASPGVKWIPIRLIATANDESMGGLSISACFFGGDTYTPFATHTFSAANEIVNMGPKTSAEVSAFHLGIIGQAIRIKCNAIPDVGGGAVSFFLMAIRE